MRPARIALYALLLSLFACGDNLAAPDAAAPVSPDATADATVDSAVDAALVDSAPMPDTPMLPPDAAPIPDADPATLDCLGEPLPPAEDTSVTVSGQVYTVTSTLTDVFLDDAEVEVFLTSDIATPIASATTDNEGAYSVSGANGGVALDAFLRITRDQFNRAYQFPATPLYQEELSAVRTLVFSRAQINFFSKAAGVVQDPANGIMVVQVIGCNGTPLTGATVVTNPPAGQVVYTVDGLPVADAVFTDASGTAFLFNVPVGTVEVDADYLGDSLREHSVLSEADALTTTMVQP